MGCFFFLVKEVVLKRKKAVMFIQTSCKDTSTNICKDFDSFSILEENLLKK